MNKFLTLLIFAFLLFPFEFINAQIPSYVPTNGLVAWYPFNGNANDESGNGNNGTVNGATLTTDRFGEANKAFLFNSSSNILVGHNSSFNLSSNYTISVWYYTSLNTGAQDLVIKGPDNDSRSWWLRHHGNNFGNYESFATGADITNRQATTSSFEINVWVHLCGVLENSVLKIYKNGVLKDSVMNVQNNASDNSFNLIIGTLQYGSNTKIDDVGLYNRALTQQEITALYNASTPTILCLPSYLPTNGLVGYWPFCGNANDESGNGNNGTVNGATLTTDRFGVAGKAYSFDGVSNYIQTTAQGIAGRSSRSISFWIKTSSTSIQTPLDCYGGTGGSFYPILNSPCPGLGIDAATGVVTRGDLSLINNSWHHCMLVFDSTSDISINQVKIYIDAILQNSISCSALNPSAVVNTTNVVPYVFGKTISNVRYFNGSLDDIAIYSRALTQQEITALYSGVSATSCTATITPTDTTICRGTSVSLTATSTSSSGVTSTLPTNLQTGLVGYWPFNGNANDESGNGNNGTVNGATLTTDRFGNAGKAYSFDGVNNYIDITNTFFNNGWNNYSISLWMKSSSFANNGASQLLLNSIPHDGWGIAWNSAGNSLFSCAVNSNPAIHAWDVIPSNQTWNYSSALLNNWYHLTFVRSGETYKCYVNGLLDTTIQTTISPITAWMGMRMGQIAPGWSGEPLNGSLDDIAIWNRSLTNVEVQQLYSGNSYLWSTGDTTATISVSPTTSTTYYCTITDANGATCTDSVRITVNNCSNPCLPSYLPTNGLVGYWPFCGNANDESGYGNNGTVNGATLTTDRFGVAGKAYSFDGVSNYIQCVNSGPTGNSNITIAFWTKSISNSSTAHLVSWGGNGSSGQDFRILANPYSNCNSSIAFDTYNSGIGYSNSYSQNSWEFYVITYDATIGNSIFSAKIYKNGLLLNSNCFIQNFSSTNISNLFPITFGRYHGNIPTDYLNGILDDIAIYNRVLTQQEITALYNASSPPTPCTANIIQNDTTICRGASVSLTATSTSSSGVTSTLPTNLQTGLVGYWPFNGNANDESGNGNNGTVNGATLTTDRFGNAGKAYSFDGLNDYINVNTINFGGGGNYSVSCWVYMNVDFGNQSQHYVFDNRDIGLNNGICLNIDASLIQFVCGDNYLNTSILNWHHIVGITSNNNKLLFIDGVLVSTAPSCNYTFQNSNPLKIGTSCFNNENTNGSLDDIAIWNRALTPQEVQQLYNSQSQITNFQWSTGDTTATINVSPTTSTTYYCTITDANGATCTDSVRITVNTAPPATPSFISGPINICTQLGNNAVSSPGTYTVNPVPTALSYYWTVPAGATLLSGQGTGTIQVSFDSSYRTGIIYVTAINACDSSAVPRGLTVTKRIAAQPGSIYKSFVPVQQTAITSVCGVVSDTFMIRRVQFATAYLWTLSSGTYASITHLSTPGILDTVVRVNFVNNFTGDTLKVKALTDCSVSDARYIVFSSGKPAAGVKKIANNTNNFSPCIGDTITYYASSNTVAANQAPIVMYRWTLAPYVSITSATADSSVIHVKFNTGFNGGIISARGQSACGVLGSPKTYYFRYLPSVPVNIVSSNGSYNACAGNQFSYTVIDTAALALSQLRPVLYRWTLPAGAVIIWGSSDSSTITLQFNNSFNGGNLYVCGQTSCGVQGLQKRVTLTNSGCASCTANIVNNDTTICAGDSVTLTATVSGNAQLGSGLSGTLLNGLVGYWPFNGNANDESGNGNNGTVLAATLSSDRFQHVNSAYNIDGINCPTSKGVSLPASLNNALEYSLSIWFRSTDLQKQNQTYFNSSPHGYLGASYNYVGRGAVSSLGVGNGNWVNAGPAGNIMWNTSNGGSWNHIVVVKTLQNFVAYQNGVQVYNYPITPSFNTGTINQMIIGASSFNGGVNCYEVFKGDVDDIVIWNRALTLSEIQQLYNSQSQTTNYQWSNGATTPTITVSPSQSTTYTCTITSGNGAVCTDSVRVTVNNNCITSCIANIINDDTTICAGQPVTLTANSTAAGGSGLSGTLQNGLVGYWPFNGSANDESGNGNNGTVNGATLTTDRFGNAGNAYSFDGVNNYISVPTSNELGLTSTEFSLSVWIKNAPNQTSDRFILTKSNGGGSQNKWILFSTNSNLINHPGIVFNNYPSIATSGTYFISSPSYNTNDIDNWAHCVVKKDAISLSIYLNGALVKSEPINANVSITTTDFRIGGDEINGGGYWFNGSLDDIAIWNRALTPQEIQQLYTGVTTNGVTDIDGNNYPTVNIGTQTWTQKNLNVSRYRNGDIIPQVTDPTQWANLTTGAWCWYNNDSATYAATYGKLYNWYAANDPRGLAPQGWHVPSDGEWNKLVKFIDPSADTTISGAQSSTAGGAMKEIGITHWLSPNTAATNSSGFSGLPGSFRDTNVPFDGVGYNGYWWSSTIYSATLAWGRSLYYGNSNLSRGRGNIEQGFSVRCLKDLTTNSQSLIPNYQWSNGATTPTITVNPTQSTTYYCTVTYGNVSCVDSVRVTVSQTVLPTPSVITGPADVCPLIANNSVSGPVTYSIRPVAGATSYQWSVPAGATLLSGQGDTLITVSFSSSFVSGNIGVSASGPCGNSAGIRELNVIKRVPSVPGTIAKQFVPTQLTAITSVCNIQSETYMIRSVEFATSYLWTMSNGANVTISHMNNSGAQDTAVVLNFGTGFITDTLTVRSVSACSVSDGKTIILTTGAPTAAVRAIANAGGNFAPCIGDVLTYTASAYLPTTAQSAIQVFRWTLAPGAVITSATLPDSATITVSFTPAFNGGIISARGQSACGGLGSAKTVYFQYLPPTPSSIVASSGNYNPCVGDQVSYTVFVGTIYASQRPASVYRWTFPAHTVIVSANADSSVVTLQFLTGYTGGSLRVKGQTICGAQGTAKTQVLTHSGCPAGTRELYTKMQPKEFGKLEVTVMPNPTSSYFNMQVNSDQQAVSTVKLYDVQGRLLKTMLLKTNEIKSFGSELRPGVYMAEVLLGKARRVLKVVKI